MRREHKVQDYHGFYQHSKASWGGHSTWGDQAELLGVPTPDNGSFSAPTMHVAGIS